MKNNMYTNFKVAYENFIKEDIPGQRMNACLTCDFLNKRENMCLLSRCNIVESVMHPEFKCPDNKFGSLKVELK